MQDTAKRLFIAIPLPQEVKDELERIVQLLKKESFCEGTYTNVQDAHVTLQFLGSVQEGEIDTIDAALRTIAYPPCFAALGSLGSFTKRGHSAIIYVDILSPSLLLLIERIQHGVAPWIEKKEHKSFVAHVTLMRIKKIKNEASLQSFLQNTSMKHIPFTIDSFLLMQSVLLPKGPFHIPLKKYALL